MTLRAPFPIQTATPITPRIPRAPRYRLVGLTAIADLGDRYWAGTIKDLSATGCLVWSEDPLHLGRHVCLTPSHHNDSRLPLEINARVIRVSAAKPDGAWMALRFIGLSTAELEGLHSFAAGHGRLRRSA